jgi:alkylation response protein AidB-like acyl-CoA dehydrogenase
MRRILKGSGLWGASRNFAGTSRISIMADPLIARHELDFLLFDWLGVDDRETVEAILDLGERVATDLFLPHYREADIHEPRLDADGVHILPAIAAALRGYCELGLPCLSFPEALGGMGMPATVYTAVYALMAAANVAAAAYPMLTVANARLIAAFGTPAQVERFALPQIEGRWFGTMCLSEPQAGSSLADIRTRARREGEDELGARYRLSGNKMWISGGDQDVSGNIVHLVLAKAVADPGDGLPEGTRGISLFIVPKILPDGRRNDVAVAGLNHKMGYRGTANCLLNLGEGEGAVGWLVGQEGRGLAQMFMMMNEARITVGTSAAALAYRGYRHAVAYARERPQGRPSGVRGGGPVAIVEHVDVRRMLLQQKAYAEGGLALCLYSASLVDTGDAEDEALLGLLTPVTKSWSSEFGLVANDLAIQVHGGYGYTRDFDVEQLWRDNRLNPIHEGTVGIQAIDLLGRKLLKSEGAGIAALERRIRGTMERADGTALEPQAAGLGAAWARVRTVVNLLAERGDGSAFNDATMFLRAFGHVVVAWLWLDTALAAAGHADARISGGKQRCCRFFFESELPQALAWLDVVAACSDVAASAPAIVFD